MLEDGPQKLYSPSWRDRRRVSCGTRKADLKSLWQKNHEILNLALLGQSAETIANVVGVTKATVSNTLNSSLGKEKLMVMRGARDKEIIDIAHEVALRVPRCLEVVDDILETANSNIKMRAVEFVMLDLGGYAAPKKIEGRFTHGVFTPEDLMSMRKRSLLAASEAGILIEHKSGDNGD